MSRWLVWIESPYPVLSVGLAEVLKEEFRVYHDHELPDEPLKEEALNIVILSANSTLDLPAEIERIRGLYSRASIIAFSLHVDLQLARTALRSGARGFIYAGMPPEQILRALLAVSRGKLVAPRELLEFIINSEALEVADESINLALLTSRQREILDMVANGQSNAQIAKALFLSESTVKQHLNGIYKLLGAKNRTEAARHVRGSR